MFPRAYLGRITVYHTSIQRLVLSAMIAGLLILAGFGDGTAMMGFDGPPPCDTRDCFAAKVADCSPEARYFTETAAGASAMYRILGEGADGQCELGIIYMSNPNPQWVDKPLTFVVDPKRDLETQLEEALSDCLAGRRGTHRCAGPLFELLSGASGE